jgi:CPA1 family monovalent cation:H+ antiporter
MLVAGGALLGFVPELPPLTLDPDLVLAVFLPPVLYAAALATSWRDFKRWAAPIGALATGLVVVTTVCVGLVVHWLIPGLPWAAAFAFGAIVSPPDAVAATAILGRMRMPRRLIAVLESESLVNDASGLLLYKFAVAAAVTGAFSWLDAAGDFAWIAGAGIGLGLGLGRLYVWIQQRLRDPLVEVLLSLTLPYVTYLAAEKIGVSGVLAVVTAGLVRARFAPQVVSPETRLLTMTLWSAIVFLFNALIFIIIGLQLRPMLGSITEHTAWQIAGYTAALTATAVAVRLIWVFPGSTIGRAVNRWRGTAGPPPTWQEKLVTGWCGMRGLVSLVAALALPHTLASGAPFPERQLLIVLVFAFVATTLVLQGLSLDPLARWLNIAADPEEGQEEVRARAAMAHAALAEVNRQAIQGTYPEQYISFLRYLYGTRLEQLEPAEGLTGPPDFLVHMADLRIAALQAERHELIRLWHDNRIGDEVMHRLESELDLEQTRLRKSAARQ